MTLKSNMWLISDLLARFKLWSQAAEVTKLCNHPRVSAQNQQSTLIHTNCSNCSKALQRNGWLCDRCKGYINTCSIWWVISTTLIHVVYGGLYQLHNTCSIWWVISTTLIHVVNGGLYQLHNTCSIWWVISTTLIHVVYGGLYQLH